jgi:hypothetical protein
MASLFSGSHLLFIRVFTYPTSTISALLKNPEVVFRGIVPVAVGPAG